MTDLPPRLLVGIGASALAVVILGVVWLVGRTPAVPSTTTATTTTTRPAPPTVAQVPISVLPDWYRKGSSRYEDRRPVTTVPAGVSPTTAPPTTTTMTTSTTTTVPRRSTTTSSTGRSG